jgi:methionyl-tRNA formyltransferase
MAQKVDAGEIILQRETPIEDGETAGSLSNRLSAIGAELLVETLDLVERGDAPRVAQDQSLSSYARKLKKTDGEVDWSQSTRKVLDRIRGLTPWPGAYTWYGGKMLRIDRAEPGARAGGRPGEIVCVDGGALEVATGDGTVRLLEVCPEGRCSMDADAFMRGYRPEAGTRPFAKTECE